MKVLLDACVPRPLRKFLPDHLVQTAQEMGWGKLKNGALLQAAELEFAAFLTSVVSHKRLELFLVFLFRGKVQPGLTCSSV